MRKISRSKFQSGQGVVEYSGALVIAAVLVAVVLGGGVDGLSGLFRDIITAAHDTIASHLPS